MEVLIALPLLLGCPVSQGSASQAVEIQILSPAEDAEVAHKELVKGEISGSDENIYVLIHPLEASLWWVQRPPSPPDSDGTWQTLCYFGTGTEGRGEYFEVVAIVTSNTYQEGKTLAELPDSIARSQIVTVRRGE